MIMLDLRKRFLPQRCCLQEMSELKHPDFGVFLQYVIIFSQTSILQKKFSEILNNLRKQNTPR